MVAARRRPDYAQLLARDANLEMLLVDDGYTRENGLPLAQLARESGALVHRILRVESLAEQLIVSHRSLASLEAALVESLEDARPTPVALKSVIAYRTGLDIGAPDARQAADVLEAVPVGRLAAKPLNDYVFNVAVHWAGTHAIPVQLHTGFGDRDLDLQLANPLHLRA